MLLLSLALSVAISADPAKDAAASKEKQVCRTMDTTGSRMKRPRVCKTAAQWEADAELARKTMQFRERRNGM